MSSIIVPNMDHDDREIQSLDAGGATAGEYLVGRGGITAIRYYEETGQGAMVPWFAIYIGDAIKTRINGAFVERVIYKDQPNEH